MKKVKFTAINAPKRSLSKNKLNAVASLNLKLNQLMGHRAEEVQETYPALQTVVQILNFILSKIELPNPSTPRVTQ